MSNAPYSPADEKALALVYAYQALVKTLIDKEIIGADDLFRELAGAQGAAQRVGEYGAAKLLASLAEQLQGLG